MMNARLFRVRTRRGSFLVFVVGVLALLAVITVAYVTVGRADRRSAATVVLKSKQGDVPEAVRDYVLDVIKRDLFLTIFEVERPSLNDAGSAGFDLNAIRRREAFDYPSDDPYARSNALTVNSSSGRLRLFDPAGVNCDPWLASTEPEFINGNAIGSVSTDQWLESRRDWMHISNFAPDGRFVSLFNLRPQSQGGFGFDATPREMSTMLTLPDDRAPRNLPPILGGSGLGGGGATLDPDMPMHWDTAQVRAFRPAGGYWDESFPSVFSRRENPEYEWADADGDMMKDSRWIELVWAADPRPNGKTWSVLPTDDDIRWVVAFRAIDLSGQVNVNTATDLREARDRFPPGGGPPATSSTPPDFPLGLTPADVDLRRILAMQDYAEFLGLSYVGLRQPVRDSITKLPNDYAFNPDGTFVAASHVQAGEAGYDALRRSLLSENFDPNMGGIDTLSGGTKLVNGLDYSDALVPYIYDAEHRELYGREWGPRAGSTSTLTDTNGTSVLVADGFGVDSLLELLTRRGVNDPRVTSSLESVLDGRGAASTNIGPLRSNRLADEEYLYRLAAASNNSIPPALWAQSLLDPRQRLTTLSGSRRLVRMTGASDKLAPYPGSLGSIGPITAAELPTDAVALLDTITRGSTVGPASNIARHRIFEAYADALMPYADHDLFQDPNNTPLWKDPFTDANAIALRTPHYGHRGPELSLYTSAHMAANLLDMVDDDVDPTCVTVIADGALGARMRQVLDFNLNTWGNAGEARQRGTRTNSFFTGVGGINWTAGFSYWGEGRVAGAGTQTVLGAFDLNASGADVVNAAPSTLTRDRLANADGSGDVVQSPVKNIYGIEPQPILTEVASYFVYTDAPASMPGADTDGETTGVFPNFVANGNVTIDGDVSDSNPDFVLEILVFQIHNPFDVAIPMMAPDGQNGSGNLSNTWVPRYYIQFGGRFFEVSGMDEGSAVGNRWPDWGTTDSLAGGQLSEEELEPGETRLYLAIGENPDRVDARIRDLLDEWDGGACGTTNPPPGTQDIFYDFVRQMLPDDQFTVTPASGTKPGPGLMPEIDPETRQVRSFAAPDFFYDSTPADMKRQALLWRRHFTSDENAAANEVLNDQLVDRLHEKPYVAAGGGGPPVLSNRSAWLDRRIQGNADVSGTTAGADCTEGTYQSGFDEDNTGYTIMTWASIRRPDMHDRAGGSPLPKGAVPPWMIEVKSQIAAPSGGTAPTLNVGKDDPLDLNSPDQDDFNGGTAGNGVFGDTTFDGFLRRFAVGPAGGGEPPVVGTILRDPEDKHQADGRKPMGPNLATSPLYYNEFPPTGGDRLVMEMTGGNDEFRTDLGSITNQNDQLSRLRVADLLLPLGLGPSYDADPSLYEPAVASPPPGPHNERFHMYEQQWTTVPEAIGLALGYCRQPTERANDLYAHAGLENSVPGQRGPLFDRGHLRLDAFVPFIDLDRDGVLTQGTDPVSDPDEPRFGDGIPLALNVLSRFTTSRDPARGSLTRAERGLININTASIAVLRSLPMLSPPLGFELSAPAPLGGQPRWWWDSRRIPPVGGSTYLDQHNALSDIATTVAAYRDRLSLFPWTGDPFGGGAVGVSPQPVVFADASGPYGGPVPSAREARSEIDGLRERPGFASIGELLAARDKDLSWVLSAQPTDIWPHNIDRLGWNLDRNDVENTETVHHKDTGGTLVPDDIIDDYDEKLSIVNAVLGSTTTRSDYFAVWFLIHGYRRADVEGLAPEDPMVPSVARRFLMVVDRSNVVDEDDEPRVVLFEELPL